MNNFILRLLDAREERYEKQRRLIDKFNKPLISFMLNTPGREKYSDKLVAFQKLGIEKIENLLGEKILYAEFKEEITGSYYMAVVDEDAKNLKKQMMALEDSPSGRLYDIDVFDENKNQLSRSSLGENPRRCLICKKPAKVCIREQRHSYEDLVQKMNEILENDLK